MYKIKIKTLLVLIFSCIIVVACNGSSNNVKQILPDGQYSGTYTDANNKTINIKANVQGLNINVVTSANIPLMYGTFVSDDISTNASQTSSNPCLSGYQNKLGILYTNCSWITSAKTQEFNAEITIESGSTTRSNGSISLFPLTPSNSN
jgi:hypothetical protein